MSTSIPRWTSAGLLVRSEQPADRTLQTPTRDLDLVPVHIAPRHLASDNYSAVLGRLPLTVLTVDRSGIVTSVVRTQNAIPHADVIGRSIGSFSGDELLEEVRNLIAHVGDEQVVVVVEMRSSLAAAALRWVEMHLSPLYDDDGEIREIVVAVLDIEEQRRNQDLLRRHADAMSILAELSTRLLASDATEVGPMLTRALELLCEHAEMSGGLLYEIDAVTGALRLLHEWHAPGDHATAEHLERSMKARTELVFLDLLAGRDVQITRGPSHPPRTQEEGMILDELETNSLLAVPIMTPHGLRGFMAFNSVRVLDGWSDDTMQVFHVTADLIGGTLMRQAADAEIRRSERRWRFAVEGSGLAMWEWDMVKDEVTFSPAFAHMLDYDELLPSGNMITVSQMLHPDDVEAATQVFFQYLEGRAPHYEQEYRLRTADGGWRWVAARALVDERDETGRPLHLIGTYTDITERHLSEERLVRSRDSLLASNQELERLARLKDAYLSRMSHELRTPLTSILGMTEALKLQSAQNLTDRQQHYLTVIDSSGRHLLALINDVLDVAKVEAGMLELTCERSVLDAICAAAHAMVGAQAASRFITLELQLHHPPIECVVDARRMTQVILNLLSNAIKFTPEGGRVTLATDADAGAERIRISVRDTGIGMSHEEIAQLFTPYKQLRGVAVETQAGTGLGLVLARSMARLHEGDISVSSTPGVGSVFTIDIPWRHPEKGAGEEAADTVRAVPAAGTAGARQGAADSGVTSHREHAAGGASPVRARTGSEGTRAEAAAAGSAAAPPVREVRSSRDVLLWMVDVSHEIDHLEDMLREKGYAVHPVMTEREVRRTLARVVPAAAVVVMPGSIDELQSAVRWLRSSVPGAALRIMAIGLPTERDAADVSIAGADVFFGFPVDAARVDEALGVWLPPRIVS
jgi:PAS domain S-box-containing protein